jgi:glycosyltransferase involved in cell wall biosynthesis
MSKPIRHISIHGAQPPDLSLAIPCYNEEKSICSMATCLIQSFHERDINVELVLVDVLVDNGSHDATGKIIDALAAEGFPVVKEVAPSTRANV